jgi:2-polyprenyl-3-methyl-5-hydroxy-6-metoxy-1,4-benzoquinol methylase
MPEVKGSAAELARLEQERDQADRAYNEALTRVDGAIRPPRELPNPPRPYDEHQLAPLNERWELLTLKPVDGGGWLRRLRQHMWAMVAPIFERQQAFNSALVDHVNRNAAMHRETGQALAATLDTLREHQQLFAEFQTLLILYFQLITPYVDTKDRHVTGLMHGVAAGLQGLGEDIQKRWESMVARERRYDAQVNDVRTTLSVMQRSVQALARELEGKRVPPVSAVSSPSPGTGAISMPVVPAPANSSKYVGFEDQFRGSQLDIRGRLAEYLPLFEGASDVIDIGCGRGEFLDLLRERGISGHGVDLNDEMVAVCRDRGLNATVGDALSFLLSRPDESVGGILAAQVVEHLEPDYLVQFLDAAFRKMRPGSKIVLETINPACWFAFFSSYIRDVTHVRPLHPDTLQYFLRASGFQAVDVRYSAPYPDEEKLQTVPSSGSGPYGGATVMEIAFNDNFRKLNSLLFSYLDYAAIGEKL